MKKNIGSNDKAIRVIVALILIALYITNQVTGVAAIVAVVIAAMLLLTSIFGFCGLYTIFGITTCPMKKKS